MVHASDGWHLAGMCLECSTASLKQGRLEIQREAREKAAARGAGQARARAQSADAHGSLRQTPAPPTGPPPPPAAAAEEAPEPAPPSGVPEVGGARGAAYANAAVLSPRVLSPRDLQVAQYLAAQGTPHWLRPYLAELAPTSRQAVLEGQ